ncbi:hypothetical protein LguiA_011135 [Lonicera macranthoides]
MAPKTLFFLIIFTTTFSLSYLLHISTAQDVVKAAYWSPDSGFAASDIDSTLFTHLFCAFANLDSQTNQVTISSSNKASFAQFTHTVKLKNPSVKTLLSIGGGSSNQSAFTAMASQSASRQSFINSSIRLARSYGFFGIDLDPEFWQYPLTTTDMNNLGSLLDEWRAAAATEAINSGKPRLNLTAAVYLTPTLPIPNGDFPIANINRSLDWLNIMAYDFYAPAWTTPCVTHSHAALYEPSGPVSGNYGIGAWVQAGIPAKKLVLGLPFYGYAWCLMNASNHGLLAPANCAAGGRYGAMGYNQIKEFINTNANTTRVYNGTLVTDYCYSGTTWIAYDDIQTISVKVSYAKQNGLLGYFAWHVGVDSSWTLSKTG